MAVQGGPAMNVVVDTSPGAQVEGGSAIPVAVVTGRAVTGNKATRVVVVSNPDRIEGGPAIPVVAAPAGDPVEGGPAMRVYVVSGSLASGPSAPVNTALPTISGTGAMLSATTGSWSNSPTSYAYQWKRNGANIGGATGNTYTIGPSDIGATLTVTVTATNAAGSASATSAGSTLTYTQKVLATALANLIGYWPLADNSGTTATDESGNSRNGSYNNVTLGQTGIGDGRTGVLFAPASSSYVNLYTAGLAGAFNGAAGTLFCWMQVRAASVWTDGTFRRIFLAQESFASNFVGFARDGGNNNLNYTYRAGGVTNGFVLASNGGGAGQTGWQPIAITWDKAVDQVKCYWRGSQLGSTGTGLGIWSGAPKAASTCLATASTAAPSALWDGAIAHAAIWTRALSAAEIATLSTPP